MLCRPLPYVIHQCILVLSPLNSIHLSYAMLPTLGPAPILGSHSLLEQWPLDLGPSINTRLVPVHVPLLQQCSLMASTDVGL